ncbi:MAG: DNA circularization protein [Magnetovibrionaceae bacterium]
MSHWTDNLFEALIGGVPVHAGDISGSHGRRFAKHSYPQRDDAFFEDLGRESATYRLQVWVLEPDSQAKAEAVIEVCEKPGPITIVHPRFGERQVVCTGCKPTWSTRDGGMVRFDLTFEKDGGARYPQGAPDDAALVSQTVTASQATIEEAFEEAFKTDGQPGFVVDEAVKAVTETAEQIAGTLQTVVDQASAVANLVAEAETLVRNPLQLADQLTSLIDVPAIEVPWSAYEPLSAWPGLDLGPQTTPSRLIQAANAKALNSLVRSSSVISMAGAAVNQVFETAEDLDLARRQITGAIDQALDVASDTEFRALESVRTRMITALKAKAPTLPRRMETTPILTQPPLVIANRIYGDNLGDVLTRADQICSRNRLPHPGFAPGGRALEVLTDG